MSPGARVHVAQPLGGVAVADDHPIHAAGQQVVGQVDAPIVARPARLRQPGGVDQPDAPAPAGQGGRVGHLGGQQRPQQPAEPGAALPQALAPGGLGDVGHPDQHGPGAQAPGATARRGRRPAAPAAGRSAWRGPARGGRRPAPALAPPVGRQVRHDLLRPGIAGQGEQLRRAGGSVCWDGTGMAPPSDTAGRDSPTVTESLPGR